jgi:hypothetical protein
MIVVLFRSKLTDRAPADGYPEMAEEMDRLARTMPGCHRREKYYKTEVTEVVRTSVFERTAAASSASEEHL